MVISKMDYLQAGASLLNVWEVAEIDNWMVGVSSKTIILRKSTSTLYEHIKNIDVSAYKGKVFQFTILCIPLTRDWHIYAFLERKSISNVKYVSQSRSPPQHLRQRSTKTMCFLDRRFSPAQQVDLVHLPLYCKLYKCNERDTLSGEEWTQRKTTRPSVSSMTNRNRRRRRPVRSRTSFSNARRGAIPIHIISHHR